MPTQENHKGKDKTPDTPIPNASGETWTSQPVTPPNKQVKNSRTQKGHGESKNIIVEIAPLRKIENENGIQANAIAKSANNIAIWSIVVNGCLFLVTLALFLVTRRGIDAGIASSKANDYASKATYKDTKKYIERFLDIQNKLFTQTKAYNDASLTKQQTALDKQIASLNERQKEFEIENRPLVEILDIKIDAYPDGPVSVKYKIENFGKQPVKCISNKSSIGFSYSNSITPAGNPSWTIKNMNFYLIANAITEVSWKSQVSLTKEQVKAWADGEMAIYLFGFIRFKNNVTFDTSIYEYKYRMIYNRGIYDMEAITDTTYRIKPGKR